MVVNNSPPFQLCIFTRKLYGSRNDFTDDGDNFRSVYGTIINRAYYSSYLLSLKWISEKYDFKFTNSRKSKHEQVRKSLMLRNEKAGYALTQLKKLRLAADYNLEKKINHMEVLKSLKLMDLIFNELKFSVNS